MTDDEPQGIGALLHAMLAPPAQDGPPYTYAFQQPEPVPVVGDEGLPVLDDEGEPVMQVLLLPTHTLTHVPDWSTHEGFVATFGEPIVLVPHRPRKPKQRKRRKR